MKEYAVSCAQMKILEQNTDAAGLSYYQMMENAGTIAANRIVEITITSPINDTIAPAICGDKNGVEEPPVHSYAYQLDRPIRVRVYCGKGNNGGDGFVVARLLYQRGWAVELVLVDGEPTTPDAIANYKLTREQSIPAWPLDAFEGESEGEDKGEGEEVPSPDVVVDAIYGTGFHGQLRENGAKAAAQIAAARAKGARVFALDIPSGMGGDLTEETTLDSRCVRADVTITFHAKKPVHLQPFAKEYCGQIITADIGIVDPDRDRYNKSVKESVKGDTVHSGAPAKTDAAESSTKDAPAEGHRFDPDSGETYDFDDFVEIISQLRAPGGCPWDREQTHQTLKKYLLEETGEAAEAIDNEDDENLCEELGDVLLQIVLHAQIGRERGAFTIDDVLQGISEKMIRRHPWVFGDMQVDTPEEGERLWEQIKEKEKKEK